MTLEIDPYFHPFNVQSSPATAAHAECIRDNWGRAGSLHTPQPRLAPSLAFFLPISWKTAVPEKHGSEGGITYTPLLFNSRDQGLVKWKADSFLSSFTKGTVSIPNFLLATASQSTAANQEPPNPKLYYIFLGCFTLFK